MRRAVARVLRAAARYGSPNWWADRLDPRPALFTSVIQPKVIPGSPVIVPIGEDSRPETDANGWAGGPGQAVVRSVRGMTGDGLEVSHVCDSVPVLELLCRRLLAASYGEARRLIAARRVTIDGQLVTDMQARCCSDAAVEVRRPVFDQREKSLGAGETA